MTAPSNKALNRRGQVVGQLHSFMQAPAVVRWWSVRGAFFHAVFRQFVDELSTELSVPGGVDVLNAIKGVDSAAVQV